MKQQVELHVSIPVEVHRTELVEYVEPPDSTYDPIQQLREQQVAFNQEWIGAGRPKSKTERVGFAVISSFLLVCSITILVDTWRMVLHGVPYMPCFSAVAAVIAGCGLFKALRN